MVSAAPPPEPPEPRAQGGAADAPHAQRDGGGARGRHAGSGIASYLEAGAGAAPCDPALKPSAAWTLGFLRSFARLRRSLQREEELEAAAAGSGGSSGLAGVPAGLHAQPLPPAELDEAAAAELAQLRLEPPSDAMPELQALHGLDQVCMGVGRGTGPARTSRPAEEWQRSWHPWSASRRQPPPNRPARGPSCLPAPASPPPQLQIRRQLHAAIREVVREGRLDAAAAPRLYALAARLEKPLHAGTCALLRQLVRTAAAQRAAAGGPADPALPHLNIAIAVAGGYFGQDEELAAMWDEDREEF